MTGTASGPRYDQELMPRESRKGATLDRPLRLAELIDLELALLRDHDRSLEELDARDAPLAERLRAEGLDGRTALRAWLDHVREPGSSLGERVSELRDLTALALFAGGTLAGMTTVGGWLLAGTGTPVNVIYFWPSVIGVQLALLVLWGLAALPARWISWLPGVRAAQTLLQAIGRALPWLAGRGVLGILRSERARLVGALAELRRLDWLYGRLRLWIFTGLTQSLAVGFNLGALVAFVAIPYVDDPAFGWRSRLLDPPAVHRMADAVSRPWSAWFSRAHPTLEDVAQTRYSSIDASLARERRGPQGVWAVWWPFLVASLLFYGLVPRLVLWVVSRIGLRMELRRAPRAHADAARLRERLSHPPLDSRARSPEERGKPGVLEPDAGWASLPAECGHVLCWSGVPLDPGHVQADLHGAGVEVRGPVLPVGGLDPEEDRTAVAAARDDRSGPPCLIVPAWEPPLGDYTDFVRQLRNALGENRPLFVLLFAREGRPDSSRTDLLQWRGRLRELADPWLHVAPWPARAS